MLTVVAPASMTFSTTSQRKSGGVLRRVLDVVEALARVSDGLHRPAHHLRGGKAQLELAVDGAGGEEDVAALAPGRAERLGHPIDVLAVRPGESAHGRALDLAGDRRHRFVIAGRGSREARLEHVDTERLERARHPELLLQVHAGAGRLLAVAQAGVEDDDSVAAAGFGGALFSLWHHGIHFRPPSRPGP